MSGSSMNHELCALTLGSLVSAKAQRPLLHSVLSVPWCNAWPTGWPELHPAAWKMCFMCFVIRLWGCHLVEGVGCRSRWCKSSASQWNPYEYTWKLYLESETNIQNPDHLKSSSIIFHKDKVSPANSRQVFRHSVPRPGPGFPSLTAATVQGLEKCLRPGIEVLQRPM
jgi:hypothetical protein